MSKKNPFSELAGKSSDELAQLEADLAAKRFSLRIQHAVGQVENTADIRKTRRELARVKTAIKLKSKLAQ
jgi:large subunit ribosomal protein L29